MPDPIIHFEIPADDVGRAKTFYAKAFGWKISDPWKMNYFLVETHKEGGAGINGGLMPRKMSDQIFMNYVGVASIDKAIAKVAAAGGTILMGKSEVAPGAGWIAVFQDTEGNKMGLHQPPKDQMAQASKKAAAKTMGKKAVKKAARKPAQKSVKKAKRR